MFVKRAERVHTNAVDFGASGIPGNTLAADADACGDAEKRISTLCKLGGADATICTQ